MRRSTQWNLDNACLTQRIATIKCYQVPCNWIPFVPYTDLYGRTPPLRTKNIMLLLRCQRVLIFSNDESLCIYKFGIPYRFVTVISRNVVIFPIHFNLNLIQSEKEPAWPPYLVFLNNYKLPSNQHQISWHLPNPRYNVFKKIGIMSVCGHPQNEAEKIPLRLIIWNLKKKNNLHLMCRTWVHLNQGSNCRGVNGQKGSLWSLSDTFLGRQRRRKMGTFENFWETFG